MCGILGGNNSKWDYKKGIDCLKHRGPDGVRISLLDEFVFAFSRLAIIDLSEQGMQPMFSLDKKVCILFNGEIYGYKRLRKDLIKRGYMFRSVSDTEVLLNAYLEWGEKFVTKIDGMFSIAVYDGRDKKIRLFRDRIGIKPLYYFYDGRNFGFASELKGIVNMCSTIRFKVDNTSIYDYINYLYIPEPKTLYKNVYKLLPGYCLTFDLSTKRILKNSSYWKLIVNPIQGKQRKQSELIEELKLIIKESVEEQMIADVSVGTFLSGGVDSGIVTYESSQINPQLEAFSVGFDDIQYNELEYAHEIANAYGVRLTSQIFSRKFFRKYYTKLKEWVDEPFGDISVYPTYLVSKIARNKVTVVLTGDGGDEVFGGYEKYRLLRKKEEENGPDNLLVTAIYNRYRKSKLKDYYWQDDLSFLLGCYGWHYKISDNDIRKRLQIDNEYDMLWAMRKYYCKDFPPITRAQYMDFKTYLPGDILTKVDRASMAVSLEARVPLLSRKLIEFSFSLSEQDRCPQGELKGLLKIAYSNEIGKRILNRSKMGFNVPESYFGNRKSPQEYMMSEIWKI